ncbi:hypothetical protein J3R30DRAFT_3290719 [Lentinula aciculospora]|uniref:Actin-like ATPase domain-containing protein n=1 Tax=Lentinula aciculospora TaxID=153920 RepID=A0A9W9DMQ7_9AGAR|nr:hypothetical protein J3R30DRAFT_3290719 [Lentinula aciculospora]
MSSYKPFAGTQQGLVLAIDIGTTYSGCSFSVLDPGVIPEIRGVTRFPAQAPGGSSKIPSVLYYDSAGKVRAIGAETLLESNIEKAEDEQWAKVEWFKLHLRPKTLSTAALHINQQILSLPRDKSLIEVFADFLKYLYSCCQTFIGETLLPDGKSFWESVEDRIVLSHPNGWEGPQQDSMRQAAVLAGLVTEKEDRIHFVTEGEASLHFCIDNGLKAKDEGTIIVDAGGGTIDLSAYSISNSGTNSFEEISRSECCFAGSIFVTEQSRTYFTDKLQETSFQEDIPRIAQCFDQTTKLHFRDSNEVSYVKFGRLGDHEPALDIRSGRIKIPGTTVASFFQPCVNEILKAIDKQRSDASKPVTAVFLVGGFAASPWILLKLTEHFEPLGLSIKRPDTHVNKAVSDGGVSFYLNHFVGSRVSRYSYGVQCSVDYDVLDLEHRQRGYCINPIDGRRQVENCFSLILQKGVGVKEAQEFRHSFYCVSHSRLQSISTEILEYHGINEKPSYVDVDCGIYFSISEVTPLLIVADISKLSRMLVPIRGTTGLPYFRLEYDVVLLFGRTELKAQIAWQETVCSISDPISV